MAAQLSYGYSTPKAIPGAKADLSPDIVVSRRNEANDGVLKFGMAVAVGTTAGKTVKPVSATTDTIEGVFVAAANTEQDMEGTVIVKKGVICDIMKFGHVWGRLAPGSTAGTYVTPTYGAKAYVICSGDNAGCFTPTAVASGTGATADIGAVFGNEYDATAGIGIIYLK